MAGVLLRSARLSDGSAGQCGEVQVRTLKIILEYQNQDSISSILSFSELVW